MIWPIVAFCNFDWGWFSIRLLIVAMKCTEILYRQTWSKWHEQTINQPIWNHKKHIFLCLLKVIVATMPHGFIVFFMVSHFWTRPVLYKHVCKNWGQKCLLPSSNRLIRDKSWRPWKWLTGGFRCPLSVKWYCPKNEVLSGIGRNFKCRVGPGTGRCLSEGPGALYHMFNPV